MFKCDKCASLESEVKFLREQNKTLSDRIACIADARAFLATSGAGDSKDCYGDGGSDEEYVAHDRYGQPIVVVKNPETEMLKEDETFE